MQEEAAVRGRSQMQKRKSTNALTHLDSPMRDLMSLFFLLLVESFLAGGSESLKVI